MFRKRLLLFWGFLILFQIVESVSAAPEGARLYSQHCAACHGAEGDGGVGVPLALPAFLNGVTDEYLKKTIRLGRPGRVMPAFSYLSDAQLDAIVTYLRSLEPTNVPLQISATPVSGDVSRGEQLYKQHCAACHGQEGGGGKGTGVTFSRPRDLPIIAPALNNQGFLKAASDPMIKHTLMMGREGTPMQSFLEQGLSESDVDDIVAFVRSFDGNGDVEAVEDPQHQAPILIGESAYSLEQTVANVKNAVIGANYRVIRVQPFNQGLVEPGSESNREVIVYFCNFPLLNEMLALDPRVGLFLPCRVTVVEREGKVQVLAVNPMSLSLFFNNSELDRACQEMQNVYSSIIEEATL